MPSYDVTSMSSKAPRQFDLVGALILLIALSMPVVVAYLAARPGSPSAATAPPATQPTAQLITATRELKLITMTVESRVRSTKIDESWRGTASATVEVPVKYYFGVDLSKIDDHSFSFNPLTRTQTLTSPPPTLIAIEVNGSHPISERVDVTGLRFKKLSGADQLNLAQKALYDAARAQQLSKSDLDKIRLASRSQIQSALAPFLHSSTPLRVRFVDD